MGGHFAGAVFNCKTRKAIVHKTFHRYTTRRKQGGAQSSNDGAKGAAHSAGASIRRYNEQALQNEIRELLVQWKSYLAKSDLIFVHAPGASRRIVFYDTTVLDASDERVRSFPFTTRRPTFTELERCLKELTTVRMQEMSAAEEAPAPSPKPPASKPKAPATPPPTEPTEPEVHAPHPALAKLADLCRRGKVDLLQSLLAPPTDINERLPDDLGVTLLHIAAAGGHPETVTVLLDAGADPTIRSLRRGARAYDVASTKDARDAFRRFVARAPDRWDYKAAGVPGPLTDEMEAKQRERDREKRKKQKEKVKASGGGRSSRAETPEVEPEVGPKTRKKVATARLGKSEKEAIGMTPERRAMLDREKRALAAEARMRSQQQKCAACATSLVDITSFDKAQFRYCSMACVQSTSIFPTMRTNFESPRRLFCSL
ncbi:hypothetical protein BDK51DRAFT_43923 [Blyttiomyces helicus]|uniref:VLRF1 domain-containing protein n=1 Tax=Blyttiomyces helicus TaxID=388810 RepID=A0A4P9W3Z1_9FUNG|nr:hypothetical protein BDK51DRAFT_43923 [Blyttiomyces helicus]|eukprot:RKO84866.1 hypothetical protein BDK51DRAFT_43923 [Blyttiomyces helicus]